MRSDDLIHAGRTLTNAGGVTIGLAIGAPAAIGLGALLTNFRWAVNSVNTALIFMMLVVAVAALGGRTAGVITALVSAMSYDFFHTRPYLSMAIESRDDVETTVLLLLAGLVVGAVANTGRTARHREHLARTGVRRIHRVAEAVATGRSTADVVLVAQDEISQTLDLSACWFEAHPYTDDVSRARLGRGGMVEAQSAFRFRRDSAGRMGFELPVGGVELNVLARGRPVGRFIMVPSPDSATSVQDRLATVAIADQVGAAWSTPLE